MRKTKCDILCPGCKVGKTTVEFKKPSLFSPTMITFTCVDCHSDIWAKISKKPGTPALQVNIASRVFKVSPMLQEMMAEEHEQRLKAVEAP